MNTLYQCFCSSSSIQNATTGSCFPNEGQVCRDIFSTTLPSMSSSPRLHSAEQKSVESILKSVVMAIDTIVTQPECNVALTTMLCHYTLPPCHANNNSVTQFCVSECHQLFSKCGNFIQQLEAFMIAIPSDVNFSFPRCSELYNASKVEEPCTKLGIGKYYETI